MRRPSSALAPLGLLLMLLLPLGAVARTGTNSSAWAPDGPLCLQSCKDSLWQVPFGDVPHGTSAAQKLCTSRLELRSTFLCLRLYCLPEARDQAYEELYETCLAQAGVSIPPLDIVAGYTREQIGEMERVHQDDKFAPDEKVEQLMIPASALFAAWLVMMQFWAVVVIFGTAYRLFIAVAYKLRPKSQQSRPIGVLGSAKNWLQRKVILPATFGHRCAQSIWWCTIPTRIQTLTLTAFLILNIACSIHGYRLTAVNLYFPTTEQQIFRYVSDRTGIISFANFPAIWLFGMRNNVAMWLTGWDFGAYNNFHRWVARIATLQAVIHSVGYTVLIWRQGGWKYFASWWVKWWWCAGEIATVVMCLLLACSVYWMRREKYELFLVLHIVMSVIILGTMLGHVSIFNGEYDALFWVPLVIWILDRVLRLVRVLVFKPKCWSTPASVTYNESSNILRLQVPAEQTIYKVSPGTFYYLSVLDVSRSWESHPFTVASVSQGGDAQAEQMPLLETGEDAQDIEETEVKLSQETPSMTFLVRPYDSFTDRLKELAVAQPETSPVRLLVDGPYGSTLPLERFSHVLFIVGGSGVVLPLSYLDLLTNKTQSMVSVDIHWAVREPAFARDVLINDMADALTNEHLSVNIYGPSRGHNLLHGISDRANEHYGRPDIGSIVASKLADQEIERLAVVACGPAGMADDSRRAVVDALAHAPFAIEYFEEHFTW
ncbi:hypothetical protein PWT90_03214 [Aphanocladium album]|nr:hypothetical protein PWT90_03214 [Aphanocladium album]